MTDETREQIEIHARNFSKRNYFEPAADYIRDGFIEGATHQHPIAYSQGLAEGRRQAVEEALKELAHYKDLFEYKEDYWQLKKELEKLKGK